MLEKISFNPGASFVTSKFFLPGSPLGVSIFFCLESKSLNTTKLKKSKVSLYNWQSKSKWLGKTFRWKVILTYINYGYGVCDSKPLHCDI